ncbi:ABC transporter permease [Nocardia sp. CDC160]|uniref:ABC transporter permease n=1 Tax=Nocardia sp. CDC160 TaxID=3112166 RepID=UPI002DBBA76C|nr:ABC transporter permease [Nocardia sp. CDC160]MEC3919968.1 ABC transporter permease [Nocardia sp. CDC160]
MTTTVVRSTPGPRAAARSLLATLWPPAAAVLVTVLLWWLATSVLSPEHSLLRQTAPQRVFPAIVELYRRGVLVSDAAISLWRLVIGLAIAMVIGVPAGLLIGLSARIARAATPVVQFLRMISPLSWTPIAIAVFGIGNQPVYFLVAAAAVWPVLLNTVSGVHAIDRGFLDVARSFHATRLEQLRVVIIPAVRDHVRTGLRLGLGTAWIVLVPAEMLGVRSGLGYQILNARDQLAYDQVVAIVLVIGVLGSAVDFVASRLPGRSVNK